MKKNIIDRPRQTFFSDTNQPQGLTKILVRRKEKESQPKPDKKEYYKQAKIFVKILYPFGYMPSQPSHIHNLIQEKKN